MNDLREKLQHLPSEPGIYVMKDAKQRIIYVGKAKSLKNRVSSYFRTSRHENPRTQKLVENIRDFAIFVVHSETEALLLERTLIRHHRPLYNVLFTDDKEYPLIRVTTHKDYPTFRVVRKRANDGATYLGPFGSGHEMQLLLELIHKIFPLVRCSPWEFSKAKRPCNYYAMGQCLGPCTLPVDKQLYRDMVDQAIAVLQGKNQEVSSTLKTKMLEASQAMNYEQAALYRNQLLAMEHIKSSEQVVLNNKMVDSDIIGVAASDDTLCICLLKIRESKLTENTHYTLALPLGNREDALFEFLLQYYGEHSLPAEIVVPFVPSNNEELSQLFTAQHKLVLPQRGKKKSLLAIAMRNAQLNLEEVQREHSKREKTLEQLQRFLSLPRIPHTIECLDISHHQGSSTVASIVCFKNALPSKKDYRHYNQENDLSSPDDFKSIELIMHRRLQKAVDRDESLPDLMIIDGGKGQLQAALKAARSFNALSCPIVALAKSRTIRLSGDFEVAGLSKQPRSSERIFVPGRAEPLVLEEGSEIYRLLTHIRDEAHRFAITYHRKKSGKRLLSSPLDTIVGIGPSLKKRILTYFPSQEALKQASIEDLAQIPGVSESLAASVYNKLRTK